MNTIYCITNKINGKQYIGKRKNDNDYYMGSGIYIKRAIEKYGRENFTKTILDTFTGEDWRTKEIYWINKMNSKIPFGYNIANGGSGTSGVPGWCKGLTKDIEPRLKNSGKMRSKQTKGKKYEQFLCPEAAKKMRDFQRKSVIEKWGKQKGEKFIKQKSLSFKDQYGEKRAKIIAQKISKSNMGKKHTPQNKEKIRLHKLGEKNPNYKHIPQETQKQIKELFLSGINISQISKRVGFSEYKVGRLLTGKNSGFYRGYHL